MASYLIKFVILSILAAAAAIITSTLAHWFIWLSSVAAISLIPSKFWLEIIPDIIEELAEAMFD